MLILIKSKPYETENVMGALFIALSSSEAGNPTNVVFVEDGLYCLIKDQNIGALIDIPAMSDILMSLVGAVKFYYIGSERIPFENIKEKISGYPVVLGVKKIDYSQLSNLILTETGRDIIIL